MKKRLSHRTRIGQASGFNDDPVKVQQTVVPFGGQHGQRLSQILPYGAADTAVVHLDDLLLAVGQQDVVVDAFLTEFVLYDGDFLPVRFAQYALEERGFARAQKAGEDGGGNECHVLV